MKLTDELSEMMNSPRLPNVLLVLQTSVLEIGFDTSLYTSNKNNGVSWNLINLSLFPFTFHITKHTRRIELVFRKFTFDMTAEWV